jgi:hypothetical protein
MKEGKTDEVVAELTKFGPSALSPFLDSLEDKNKDTYYNVFVLENLPQEFIPAIVDYCLYGKKSNRQFNCRSALNSRCIKELDLFLNLLKDKDPKKRQLVTEIIGLIKKSYELDINSLLMTDDTYLRNTFEKIKEQRLKNAKDEEEKKRIETTINDNLKILLNKCNFILHPAIYAGRILPAKLNPHILIRT